MMVLWFPRSPWHFMNLLVVEDFSSMTNSFSQKKSFKISPVIYFSFLCMVHYFHSPPSNFKELFWNSLASVFVAFIIMGMGLPAPCINQLSQFLRHACMVAEAKFFNIASTLIISASFCIRLKVIYPVFTLPWPYVLQTHLLQFHMS